MNVNLNVDANMPVNVNANVKVQVTTRKQCNLIYEWCDVCCGRGVVGGKGLCFWARIAAAKGHPVLLTP